MAMNMMMINPINLNLNKTRNPYPNSYIQHTQSLKSSQISNTHEPNHTSFISAHSLVQQFDPNIPIQEALTPPSSWYTSTEFLSLEFDQVFFKGWQAVGCTAQVQEANSFFTGRLGNIEYVVCRDEYGELHAFHNVCRHHASLLAFGSGKGSCFTCPYHGWTYGLNGALLKATRITGIKNFNVNEFGLVPLRVAVWGPFILLNLEKGAFSQQGCDDNVGMEWLGSSSKILSTNGVDTSLSYVCRREYIIECNWKDRYGPWMDTNLILPLGPRRCKVVFDYFLEASLKDDEAFVAKGIEYNEKLQMEDFVLCQAVQRGLESPAYSRGRYVPMVEEAMHHFHCLLHQNLIK
ncbi:choline monooxygenase, chloroplastic isoform X2 [Helianthus annuus]|uniref:choline monooxygenase, chloroplastic isoform X2 n=1 Tax=Helianthus annuus TaxID=4232 RepID=UPI000B903878|nr:choline monooxygenase, chloroplastic isoform X2 [Helianthus annuus]